MRGHNRIIRTIASATAATLVALGLLVTGQGSASQAPAQPATSVPAATIEASLAPDRLNARTASTVALHIAGGEDGVPPAVRKIVLLVPAGFSGRSLEWPSTRGCSRTQLMRRGASGCPARSQIGSGTALVAWREGSKTVTEHARLWEFLGPVSSGEYKLEILGEGTSPIHRREVTTVSLAARSGVYSAELESAVPPIPTRRGQPDASIVSFSITTGNAKPPRFSGGGLYGGMGLFVPSPCPAGGFPWSAELTFADGSVQHATTATPCP
jgi:hypothetical protein